MTATPVLERPLATQGAREKTATARAVAVERAVAAMRERLGDQLGLNDLARVALLSAFHFNRVFRLATGVPPGRFLTAVRMDRAKRLLLTTDLRVTDVCFEVGYQSLGTFTSRFHDLVGVAPQQLRALAHRHGERTMDSLRMAQLARPGDNGAFAPTEVAQPGCSLDATLRTRDGRRVVALVGAFARAVAEGPPVACAAAEAPGRAELAGLPPGAYSALAVGFPHGFTVFDALLADPGQIMVGAAQAGTEVQEGRRAGRRVIELRKPRATDPPVVLAVPLLYAERASGPGRDTRTAVSSEGRNGWLSSV